MKKKFQHIVFPFFLILNLVFSQVSVNFLHTPHREHEPDVKKQSDLTSMHRHGEHCKICSLDVVINFLAETVSPAMVAEPTLLPLHIQSAAAEINSSSTIRDRAPPVFA